MIGDGIASAVHQEHTKQRRIMGPAFTLAHVRQMTPVFTSKAEALSSKIRQIVKDGGQKRWNTKGKESIVNVTEFLDAASFDIIGKAGFGVDFGVSGYPFFHPCALAQRFFIIDSASRMVKRMSNWLKAIIDYSKRQSNSH